MDVLALPATDFPAVDLTIRAAHRNCCFFHNGLVGSAAILFERDLPKYQTRWTRAWETKWKAPTESCRLRKDAKVPMD